MSRHTTRPRVRPQPAGAQRTTQRTERVLLIAACAGARCGALQRLRTPATGTGTGSTTISDTGVGCGTVLHAAVRERHDAVLLSTACLGPCHRGSIAAVGWALTRPEGGGLDWLGPPLLLSMLDSPARAAAAADWIRHGAPARATLPTLLADPDVA